MKKHSATKKLEALILSSWLLAGLIVLSVLTVQGQGRRGGDSDRSSSRSSSSSSGSSRASSSSSSSRSSTSGNSSTGNSGRSRGGDESRKRGGDNGSRDRERGVRNNPGAVNNSGRSGNDSQAFNRDRERGGRDRDRDSDRDGDRHRHRHRHRHRDRDGIDDRIWRNRETRVYQASNYGNYRYGSNAYDQGYHDGLYTGANDGRRGQAYDPERSHFYKHGAGGFLSIFGSPASYSQAYRDGFLRGYDEGFRNYQNYFVGGRFHR